MDRLFLSFAVCLLAFSPHCPPSPLPRQVRADPISAFGGIVAFNRPVDAVLAKEIREFRCEQGGEMDLQLCKMLAKYNSQSLRVGQRSVSEPLASSPNIHLLPPPPPSLCPPHSGPLRMARHVCSTRLSSRPGTLRRV